jgi:hypothetical protein
MHDELAMVLESWPDAERELLARVLPRLVADMRAMGATWPHPQ